MSPNDAPAPNSCIACKRTEGGPVAGVSYVSNGDNGMIVRFWMCDECALKLSPGQGPIDMDDPGKAAQER